MDSKTFVEDFKHGLEFTPMEGRPNVYSIHSRRNGDKDLGPELTAEEWDKFEKAAADAFERIP
ncbi:MAG: hypothetical protein ACR2NX_05460 [Chthoniobacterales bacterium]